MIKEYFGIPGIGKTTQVIKNSSLDYKEKKNHKQEKINAIELSQCLKTAVKYKLTIYLILATVFSFWHFIDCLRMSIRLLKKITYLETIVQEKESFVYDELVIQSIWSLLLKVKFLQTYISKKILQEILPLYKNVSIVYMKPINLQIIKKRILSRQNTSRFDSMSDRQLDFYLDKGVKLFDIIICNIEKEKHIKLQYIES